MGLKQDLHRQGGRSKILEFHLFAYIEKEITKILALRLFAIAGSLPFIEQLDWRV